MQLVNLVLDGNVTFGGNRGGGVDLVLKKVTEYGVLREEYGGISYSIYGLGRNLITELFLFYLCLFFIC